MTQDQILKPQYVIRRLKEAKQPIVAGAFSLALMMGFLDLYKSGIGSAMDVLLAAVACTILFGVMIE